MEVNWLSNYNEAIERARQENKMVFLDFFNPE